MHCNKRITRGVKRKLDEEIITSSSSSPTSSLSTSSSTATITTITTTTVPTKLSTQSRPSYVITTTTEAIIKRDEISTSEQLTDNQNNLTPQIKTNIKKPDEHILRNCLTSSSTNLVNSFSNYSRVSTQHQQQQQQQTHQNNTKLNHNHQQNNFHRNNILDTNYLSTADMRGIIFNLSMGKLSRYRQSPDPRLVRSVLICNTLKRLEKDLDKEGIKINFGPSGVSFFPPITTQNMTLDPPPNASQSSHTTTSSTTTSPSQSSTSLALSSNLYASDNDFYMEEDNEKLSDEENDAEKYLLDLDAGNSGRVTPFPRSPLNECLYNNQMNKDVNIHLSSDICSSSTKSSLMEVTSSTTAQNLTPVTLNSPSSSLSSSSTTHNANTTSSSALWNTVDEHTDRLTSLNWSSVLNFGSINSSINNSLNDDNLDTMNGIDYDIYDDVSSTEKCLETALNVNCTDLVSSSTTTSTTSLHTLMPPVTTAESVSSMSHLITHHHNHIHHIISSTSNSPSSSPSSISSSVYSSNSTNDEIFGDIDLSLYDFDLISPLSPPNVKLAPVTAEELIQAVSSDSNTSSSHSSISSSQNLSNVASFTNGNVYTLVNTSPSTGSSPTTCGSSVNSKSAFHTHYLTNKDKLLFDEMSSVMS